MNWYKIASGELQENLDNTSGLQGVTNVLNQHGLIWEKIEFPNEIILKVGKYIIADVDYPELEDPIEWIYRLSSNDLHSYIPTVDFGETFWSNIRQGDDVYHGTTPENLQEIQVNGLTTQNKTRGINNRGTPSAIFTSTNPYGVSSYGNVVIEIDLGKMKEDGFMPNVSKEEPIEEGQVRDQLAYRLGVEEADFTSEYESEGLFDDTVIFHDNIPVKYLTITER